MEAGVDLINGAGGRQHLGAVGPHPLAYRQHGMDERRGEMQAGPAFFEVHRPRYLGIDPCGQFAVGPESGADDHRLGSGLHLAGIGRQFAAYNGHTTVRGSHGVDEGAAHSLQGGLGYVFQPRRYGLGDEATW